MRYCSSLLMSWISDSGVLTKRDMQNMQSGGYKDWNWEPLGYIMCHSPVRKRYSIVSKSNTIPGRKIGLLMFAILALSAQRKGMQMYTLTGTYLPVCICIPLLTLFTQTEYVISTFMHADRICNIFLKKSLLLTKPAFI